MVYVPQKGLLIRFHEKLKPYILDLVGKAYTVYKLNLLFLLSSEYSQRLIELLLEKQGYLKKQDKVFRILTIEEVREKLNVPDGKYKNRIDNFRFRVLDEPIKEINEKTNYFVWYEVKKTGRKVTGFKFWMKFKNGIKRADKTDEQSPDLPALPVGENYAPNICAPIPKSDREELTNAMVAEGMTEAAINTWIKRDGLDSVKKSFSLAVNHASQRTTTQHEGEQRRAYIKYCMENNVAAINADDARLKAEIDEREKRLAEEKRRIWRRCQRDLQS